MHQCKNHHFYKASQCSLTIKILSQEIVHAKLHYNCEIGFIQQVQFLVSVQNHCFLDGVHKDCFYPFFFFFFSTGSVGSHVSLEELCQGSGCGPLPLVMGLLTSSTLMLDLSAHQDLLTTATNLLIGRTLIYTDIISNYNDK